MLQVSVQIDDRATPAVQRAAQAMTRRASLHAVLGKRVEIELRRHFLKRNAEPNRKGWPKKGFWGELAQATALERHDDSGAVVRVAHPAARFKLRGGTITPKAARSLAIPLTADAYAAGRPALGGIAGLMFRPARRGNLVGFLATAGGEKKYALVRRVTQRGDPRTLPDEGALSAAIRDEGTRWLARQTF